MKKSIVFLPPAFVFLLFLHLYVSVYNIPSGSMEDTLLIGDYILVKNVSHRNKKVDENNKYPSKINKGDIVVFRSLGLLQYKTLIKRCIAEPGDTLVIRANDVFVNNDLQTVPLDSKFYYKFRTNNELKLYSFIDSSNLMLVSKNSAGTFRVHSTSQIIKSLTSSKLIVDVKTGTSIYSKGVKDLCNYPITIIPKKGVTNATCNEDNINFGLFFNKYENNRPVISDDYYFVMGDNRHNSIDSRTWGVVSESQIVGKAVIILFSLDKNSNGIKKIRFDRFFRKLN